MTCQCEVCKYYLEFLDHLEHVPDAHKQFFRNMYAVFVETCMDRDYYQAIVKNQWPSSEEILARYRKKETPLVVPGPVPEFKRNFEVGKTYLRADGKKVKIIAEANINTPKYCVVQGDDGIDLAPNKYIEELAANFKKYGQSNGWRFDDGRLCGCSDGFFEKFNLISGEVIEHVQV